MPKTLVTEAVQATGTATPESGGVFLIDLITPGWGSSGFYSADTLQEAAKDQVFPAGTHMYINHQTAQERNDRPEGDLRELAAVLVEDATWTGESLQAKARVFSPWRPVLDEMKEAIGVSIRASADIEFGEAEERTGRLIVKLIEAQSVDFVTKAGRGGRIVEVLEAARASVNESAIRHGVDEATANDQREALQDLLKSEYGADRTYVWLRDFDEATAWFEISTNDSEATFAQSYTTGENGLADAMTGERTEVRQVTQYVPVNPAGRSTESHRGDDMGTTQIEESELSGLREAAGRVSTLESERDAEKERADTAEAKVAEFEAKEAAAVRERKLDEIIGAADAEFTALEAAGLKTQAVEKDGVLDEAAFKAKVDEAAAEKAASNGAGTVRGNGQRTTVTDGKPTTTSEAVTLADLDESLDATFGGSITQEA